MNKLTPKDIELLIGDLARALVERTDLVETELRKLPASHVVSLRAHAADTRVLIGKGGRNFRALEGLVALASARASDLVSLAPILEPERGVAEAPLRGRKNNPMSPEEISALLVRCVQAVCELEPGAWVVEVVDDDGLMAELGIADDAVRTQAEASIKTLFTAIGTNNRTSISISFTKLLAARPQPDSARGRYTGEVDR